VTVLARWLICAQIGDGDMLAIQPDGRSFSPVPTLEKLGGERTRSLCQPDAQNSFRVAVLDLAAQPLVAVLLATDGYGNSQTADPWQPGVGRDLATFAGEHDHGWFEHQVPGWAQRCASADGSGDDTTIALLVRPDAAVAGEVPPPTVPVPAGILPPEGTSTETLELGRAGPSTETMELDRADPPTDTLELDRAPAVELGRVPAASPARPRFQVSGPARARGSGTRGSGPGGLPPVAGITSSRRTAVLIAGAIALAVLAAVIVVLFALRSSPAPGPARHVQPASHPSAAAGPRSEASATASTGTNRTDGTSDPGRARGAGPDRRQAKASGPAGTQHEGDS
jgi:Protein phosphatase 2C